MKEVEGDEAAIVADGHGGGEDLELAHGLAVDGVDAGVGGLGDSDARTALFAEGAEEGDDDEVEPGAMYIR